MNNYRRLATAHYGDTVVNELRNTNFNFISLARTIGWLRLFITLKAVTLLKISPCPFIKIY